MAILYTLFFHSIIIFLVVILLITGLTLYALRAFAYFGTQCSTWT